MALPVDELQHELTPAEVETSLYRIQEALGLPTTAWQSGSVVRLVNKAVSYVVSGVTKLLVAINKSNFTDTAEASWLSLRIPDLYGPDVKRIAASFAKGNIEIDNSGGGDYTFAAGEFAVLNPTSNKTYKNTAIVKVAPSQQNVLAEVKAIEAGFASTSAPGTITSVVTAAPGLTVTNPSALVGTDEESDKDYRVRGRESTGRLSPNGPRDAYAYQAKTTVRADGTPIVVNRVKVSASGIPVLVYVASPQGAVSGPDVALIQTAIDSNVVPDGVSATVASATAKTIDVTATVFVRAAAALVSADIIAAVGLKLTSYFADQFTAPLGGFIVPPDVGPSGKIFKNAIVGAIEDLEISGIDHSEHVIKADVSVPAGDVTIAATEVPTVGTLIISVTQV